MYVYVYVFKMVWAMYVCIDTYMYGKVHISILKIYLRMYVWLHICMYVYMYVCLYVCMAHRRIRVLADFPSSQGLPVVDVCRIAWGTTDME